MNDSSRKKPTLKQTFAALKHRNFRLFWSGQAISLIGTWMQNIAQSWLVLELTHSSAFWLGVVNALQFLPMMLFSLHAGTLIDRFSKKKMLLFTQTASAILALILALDVQLHTAALWHVLVIATLLGVINTLDMPTRQAFMIELVGKEDLMNGIILNSSIFNAARIVGPSLAGFVIGKLGIALCFFLNAISFVPVIAGIAMIRVNSSAPSPEIPLNNSQVRQEIKEGLHYVFHTPLILACMALLAVTNIFAFNFNVLIPLYARNIFNIGAQGFGLLMAANGVGAVLGSIILASKSGNRTPKARTIFLAATIMCLFELAIVPLRLITITDVLLAGVGFSMIAFTTSVNSLIQVQTPDHIRGRVMSIYTLVFMGLSPIGSFLSGSAAHLWGAPATLGIGAIIPLVFIGALILRYPRLIKKNG
jgi:MFS family permease